MAFGFSIQMAVPVKGSPLCHPQANFHRLTVRVLCGRSIDIVVRFLLGTMALVAIGDGHQNTPTCAMYLRKNGATQAQLLSADGRPASQRLAYSMRMPRFSISLRNAAAGTSVSCLIPPGLAIVPRAIICTTMEAGQAVVRIIAVIFVFGS